MNCILQRTAQRRQVGKKGYPLYKDKKSFIISDRVKDLGWMMYAVNDCVCSIDIIVLLPEERYKGHGNVIIRDILAQNPQIHSIILDVQQRNTPCSIFLQKAGFSYSHGRASKRSQNAGYVLQNADGPIIPLRRSNNGHCKLGIEGANYYED